MNMDRPADHDLLSLLSLRLLEARAGWQWDAWEEGAACWKRNAARDTSRKGELTLLLGQAWNGETCWQADSSRQARQGE